MASSLSSCLEKGGKFCLSDIKYFGTKENSINTARERGKSKLITGKSEFSLYLLQMLCLTSQPLEDVLSEVILS